MIRLDPTNAPRTVELVPGVTITHMPVTSAVWAAAGGDPSVSAMALAYSSTHQIIGVAMAAAVARRVITDWDGFGDADGNPVEPTPAWIDAMMAMYPLYEAFNVKVIAPFVLLSAEGNASASLPNGSGKGATSTVKTAAKPAKPARTGSTTRNRSKARKSGTSSSASAVS